jgi:formylglycine-generating enzyme required for sulfatase activity
MRSERGVGIVLSVFLIMNGSPAAFAAGKDHSQHEGAKGGKAVAATAAKEKDMVSIPRGEFTMGSKEHADEPAHNVVTDAYAIDSMRFPMRSTSNS